MARAALRLVELPRWPIKRMLRLEEALVRHEPGNWCLITALPPQQPTVVVGLGGKPERLLDAVQLKKRPVPVVRRFTGGGTVVVNGGVVVTSLIVDKGCEACAPFPRDIMKWTESIYRKAFSQMIDSDQFALRTTTTSFRIGRSAATRSPSSRTSGSTTRVSCGTLTTRT